MSKSAIKLYEIDKIWLDVGKRTTPELTNVHVQLNKIFKK